MSTFSRSTFNAAKYSASRPYSPLALALSLSLYRQTFADLIQQCLLMIRHYPPQLYTHVLDYATTTGNNNNSSDQKLSTLVDLGCGPGLSTFEFSRYEFFDRIYGIDPSQNMIETAKSVQATRQDREKFRFEVGNVESLREIQGIEENSIDLVVAGELILDCLFLLLSNPTLIPSSSRALN